MVRRARRHAVSLVLVGALIAWALEASAQSLADRSLESRLKSHVTHLASPELGGRANGSEGIDKARDYIADQFEAIGLKPAGSDGYVSAFSAVTHAKSSRNVALEIGDHVLAPRVEFRPAPFSDDMDFEGDAVFVGYGLSMAALGYDDYAGVDVRGKVAIALSGAPAAHQDAIAAGDASYLLSPGSKAAVALAMGARALLLVNDPRGHGVHPEQEADELPKLRPAPALEGIAVGHLTEKAAARALASAEVDLGRLQQSIDDSAAPHSRLLGITIKGDLSLERETSTLYNVQGMLPGHDAASTEPIVITAHYDGLGFGHAGTLSDQMDALHPSADDNASGVAVLIELARALSRRPPKSHPPIIFAAPAGEELGLRGSRRLAQRLVERYGGGVIINFDMLGRLRDHTIQVAHAAKDRHVRTLLAKAARAGRLKAHAEALGERYSDHISFVELGFRGLNLTTGRHGDYHMPGDTLDKLNWKGLTRLHEFIEDVVRGLAGR